MYCPECGEEYRPEIETCPTCGVALVDSPPPSADASRGPRLVPALVDLVGFIDEQEARDARRRLREAKIPSELVIRDAFGPGNHDPTGDEFWIRVPGSHGRAAADLLGLEPVLDDGACPSCGAPLKEEGACARCGHQFES